MSRGFLGMESADDGSMSGSDGHVRIFSAHQEAFESVYPQHLDTRRLTWDILRHGIGRADELWWVLIGAEVSDGMGDVGATKFEMRLGRQLP